MRDVLKTKKIAFKGWKMRGGCETEQTYRIIKETKQVILQKETDIKKRWKEYFEELLNVENEKEELEESRKVERLVMKVQKDEMKHSQNKMKNGITNVL